MCVCGVVLLILTYICTVKIHPHIGYTKVHANAHTTVVCIFVEFIVTPICVLEQLKYIHTLLAAQQSTYVCRSAKQSEPLLLKPQGDTMS